MYALRCAVEGKLGKEGKKGAVRDGLRVSLSDASLTKVSKQTEHHSSQVIHDLSVNELSVFVPASTELLPSLLDNRLALQLTWRRLAMLSVA